MIVLRQDLQDDFDTTRLSPCSFCGKHMCEHTLAVSFNDQTRPCAFRVNVPLAEAQARVAALKTCWYRDTKGDPHVHTEL